VKYPVLVFAAIALIAAAPQPQATPLPTPPDLSASATPSASPSASPSPIPSALPSLDHPYGGKHGRGGAPSATPTPPVDVRKGIDGVWEIQIQRGANTEYEHMSLLENGETISGYYLTQDKKKYPVSGIVDDQHNVRIIVTRPDGTTILLEARVDDNTDMLGMFTDSKERVPFTAAYRAKEKFIDNVNATPGGLGGLGSGGTGAGPGGGPGGP
jgi:hypothetical protein